MLATKEEPIFKTQDKLLGKERRRILPGPLTVHFAYTAVAYSTMVGKRRLEGLTL
jgi:hypothetical protein